MVKSKTHKIRQIFQDHWEDFYEKYKEQIRPVVDREVRKMQKCMNIETKQAMKP